MNRRYFFFRHFACDGRDYAGCQEMNYAGAFNTAFGHDPLCLRATRPYVRRYVKGGPRAFYYAARIGQSDRSLYARLGKNDRGGR